MCCSRCVALFITVLWLGMGMTLFLILCGAFGDDREYLIDFKKEMTGEKIFPLKFQPELQTLKQACFSCPMFQICNGCKKTIKDLKEHNLVETHCKKMKTLAPDIIKANSLDLEVTEYVSEY
jgi:radical SAM protein with 4Fe4S-binding SPASM domain